MRQISSSIFTAPTFGLEEPKELKARAKKWIEQIDKKARTMGVISKTEIIEETTSIVAGIVEFAEREGANLIVMGTRGKTGFSRLQLGSVAKGVVLYAHCPVPVVR